VKEGMNMDELEEFIMGRIMCRIHPYIPIGEGWRKYPPHMARLLEVLEPIHVVAVANTFVGVDGVYMDDPRGMREKYELAVEAVERIFGDTVEKVGVTFNTEVRLHASGSASICFFQGSIWYLSPSVKKSPYPVRFGYAADSYWCFPRKKVWGTDHVECVACVDEGPKAAMLASPKFFLDPKPENVECFGDLCLLAQMNDVWTVDMEVNIELEGRENPTFHDDPYKCVADVLKCSVGLKSFVSHGFKELLLRDGDDSAVWSWRRLLRMLEDGQGQPIHKR
jgi:hypothetical protein